MSYSHFDRLTAIDSTFLEIEDDSVHMHVGAVGIFEAKPLRAAHGGLDFERILATSEASLRKTPRFRQKLAIVPVFNTPVWVDDDKFNLLYHVRHTNLPRPGDIRQLKRLTGRIMSQKLDRGKPLWEMWFVEGLEGDRFAIITKVHHCLIDGVSGVDLLAALINTREEPASHARKPWVPRPAPTARDLFVSEVMRRASFPLAALEQGRRLLAEPEETIESIRTAVSGLGEAITAGLKPASNTPLNPTIGPHRRFDWTAIDLKAMRAVKEQLGGTVNDVVLATVAGAIRRFLKERGTDVNKLDFRAMVPVSVRAESERGALGNRVSFLMAPLPVNERDPRRRMHRVIEETQKLKHSNQAHGAEVLEELSDRTFATVFIEFARLAAAARSYNMVVTNVPGPPMPVNFLGSHMEAIYPLVPLFVGQALGIALFSYNGTLYWGFNSDWDAMPDLHEVVEAVQHEFEVLQRAAAEGPIVASDLAVGRKKNGARKGAQHAA